MIDHHDSDDVFLLAVVVEHPIASAILILVSLALAVIAWRNDGECAKQHCDRGHPALVEHECVCVEAPR